MAKPDADGVLADTQQRIDAIARYFKISPEVVYHIFDTSEEDPKLVLSTKQLAEAKAQATREITLLVGGALTALGLQTTTSQIREVADDYGKLDSPNFMTTLTNLEEISVLGKPRSPNPDHTHEGRWSRSCTGCCWAHRHLINSNEGRGKGDRLRQG